MKMYVGDIELDLADDDQQYWGIANEIRGPYDFEPIPFEKGDVVLDIGAHKGMLASYLALRFPGLRIYSYEPVPENFKVLKENLKRNKVEGVKPYQLAVTADGRKFPMFPGTHTAEASGFFYEGVAPDRVFEVKSTTVKAILGKHRIKKVKLLKLDCEGAEHEILANSKAWIKKVEYLRGEIHMIPTLVAEGYTVGDTMARFPAERSAWQVIENPALLGRNG
jgi:FkbM family methyltransferase